MGRANRRYWKDHFIDGSALDLSHLEPLLLNFHNKRLERDLCIEVKFSNHCFTEAFREGVHSPAAKIKGEDRAFDRRRYELSKNLPDLVNSLPTSSVWNTTERRNFTYFINITDARHDYQMFFHIKKAMKASCDLSMMVESAYPVDSGWERVRNHSKIHFQILCSNTFEGKPIRFHAR